ncbi:MAG: anaerobic ribonucleoside-triphosphate reductase activating protein [Candidatus Buchananbacteria bacterium]
MLIGGLQKVTLLDFPGKVAATVFTAGCNFACRFCYNPQLVKPKVIKQAKLLSQTEVLDFLASRRRYLEGVCISGGEPTVQKDLKSFCQQLKKLGYAVKLDTNGLKPEVVRQLIEKKLVDYVAMDIKAPLAKYTKVVGKTIATKKIKESIKLLLAWQATSPEVIVEFRSTLVPGLHKIEDVKQMAKLIAGAPVYYLQNFICPGSLVDQKFKPAKNSFTLSELAEFQAVAQPLVKHCEVRTNL